MSRGVHISSFTGPEIEKPVCDPNTDRRRSEQPAVTREFRPPRAETAARKAALITAPSTFPRWHGQLCTRRWTATPVRPGRPGIPAKVQALILRLSTEARPGDIASSTASSPDSAAKQTSPAPGRSGIQPGSIPDRGGPDERAVSAAQGDGRRTTSGPNSPMILCSQRVGGRRARASRGNITDGTGTAPRR